MPVVRHLILLPFQELFMYTSIAHNSCFTQIGPCAVQKASKSTRIEMKIELLLLIYCLIFRHDYSKH